MRMLLNQIMLEFRARVDSGISSFASSAFSSSAFIPALALLAVLVAPAFSADFKSFRHDLKRSGAVTEQAYPGLTKKLEYQLAGAALNSPIVYKGYVYVGDSSGSIMAFDASGDNSEPVWQYSAAGSIVSSMVADNGTVFVISQDGNLYAFNYSTGELQFSYNLGSKDASSPVIYGGCLYGATGHPNKQVYCFNLTTRAMAWTKNIGQYVYSSPAVGNGIIYIGANDGRIYALDAYTGDIRWFFETKGDVFLSTPCISSDGAYVYFSPGNDDRKIYALKAATGELKPGWASVNFGTTPTVVSSITEEDGVLYFVSGAAPSTLYAAYSADGTQKWARPLDNPSATGMLSSPVVANGVIYIGSAANKIYAIDASNGNIIDNYPTLEPVLSSPAVSNGNVYVGSGENGDGYFYIYRAAKISALTFPEDGSTVSGAIGVRGVLVNNALTSYKLEYSFGNTNTWVKVNESDSIPGNGVLGTMLSNGLREGAYSLKLTATDGTSLNSKGIISFFVNNVIASGTVSAALGGTVASPDGTEASFEPGALTEDDTVTIDSPVTYSNSAYPLNFAPTGVVRSFTLTKASNAVFKKPVTIKIPYADSEITGVNESCLRIAVWDTSKLKWMVVNTSKVNIDENKVTATVSHFSVYRLFEFKPGTAELINQETVYAYPNPALGNLAVFKCYLGQDADIKVSVYNVAGEIVAELTGSGLAGNGVELPWNIRDYASGVYIFKLEAVAKGNGEKKYVTKKFAIIH